MEKYFRAQRMERGRSIMFVIDDQLLEEIRSRANIVDVISEYVELKHSGANYMGLCPFHNEKTPSFSVSPSKEIFKCFGCGEGGDVISFIMKRENLGFRDAVKFLAEKYQIPVREYEEENREIRDKRDRFYEMNKEAAKFYFDNLRKSRLAMSYLQHRGIDPDTITKYALGYAKDEWDSLKKHMLLLGFQEEELIEVNLLSQGKNGKVYDRFRNRIMFPIINVQNRVIGFGGRVMDHSLPKYLNSTDTLIFHKGSNLYNLNIISKEQSREKIILVEGYMDVISLYKSGINYSVASLGTSLTEEQAKLMKRYAKEFFICYDGDTAGQKAADRAIDILLSVGISPRIICLEENLDPDEYIKKYGKMNFEIKCKEAMFYLDFKIENVKKNFDIHSPQGLIQFTTESAKILARVKNPIERDVYVERFSKAYHVSVSAIKDHMNYFDRTTKTGAKGKKEKSFQRHIPQVVPGKGNEKAQLELLSYSVADKSYYDMIREKLEVIDFSHAPCRILYEELQRFYDGNLSIHDFLKDLVDKGLLDMKFLFQLKATSVTFSEAEQIIPELIYTLQRSRLMKQKDDLLAKIQQAQTQVPMEKEQMRKWLEALKEINLKLNQSDKGAR